MELHKGDVVKIEILKKEKLASLVYIDEQNKKVGIQLIDPLYQGLNTNLTINGMQQNGLMLSMHRIKKIIKPSDLLNQLTFYKQEIKKSQHQQSNLNSILINKQNNISTKPQIIKNINKECIIKGLNVEYEEDEKNINNINNSRFVLNDFNIIETLGIGGCAKVKLVEHKMSRQCFAIKIYSKSDIIQTQQKTHILWEQHLLLNILNHPFIVELIDYFENDKYLYWVLELVNGGDLFSLIRDRKRLSLSDTKFYTSQIVYTFKYLHLEKHIIFRDLKPENILIDKYGYIKLGDFGIAKYLNNNDQCITNTLCGTPEYLAPELLIGRGYSFGIDWWAFGILCYELLIGKTPFISNDQTNINIYNQIITEKVIFKKKFNIDNNTQQFIKKLLIKRPNKRLKDIKLIMNHQFYADINWNDIANKNIKQIPFVPSLLNDKDTRYFDNYQEDDDDDDDHYDDDDQSSYNDNDDNDDNDDDILYHDNIQQQLNEQW